MLKILLITVLPMMAISAAADDRLNLDFGAGDSNRRIVIYADSAEFSGSGSDFVFQGNVEVIQEEIVFRSGKIEAFLDDNGSQLNVIRALESASLEWPNGTANSEFATYKVKEGLIGMFGNLKVKTEDGRLAGYGLIYEIENDQGKILKKQGFEAIFSSDE